MFESSVIDTWWEADKTELPGQVFTAARHVDDATVDEQQAMLDAYGLYGGASAWSLGAAGRNPFDRMFRHNSHNVIATACDALVSEVSQTQPRPMALTVDGDWHEQQRAKNRTRFWECKFDELRVRELTPWVVRDAIIASFGVLRPYVDHAWSCTRLERVFPPRLLFDDRSSGDSMPRVMYLRTQGDKWALAKQHPEHAGAIHSSKAPDPRYLTYDVHRSGSVEVIEAWHLPSTPTSKDGRHVIVTSECVLLDEPWERYDSFGLVFIRALPAEFGWRGVSIVNRAAPAQMELNKLLRRIGESMHLHAVPRVFMEHGTLSEAKLTTDIGVVVRYTPGKNPPVFLTPPSMASDVYQMLNTYAGWIFEEMGVSQMSATSRKPAGIDSGKAIREYNDVQSKRWVGFERAYVRMHVDLAEELVECERQLASNDNDHRVSFRSEYGGGHERMLWDEIDADNDTYKILTKAASSLPTEPWGRMQALQEMVADGTLTQEDFLAMTDDPDFEAARARVTAPREALEKTFWMMLDTGEYHQPEPFMDLLRGIDTAKLIYQQEFVRGADEDQLELLRKWIADAAALLERATPPAPPPLPANDIGPPMPANDVGPMPPPPGPMPVPVPQAGGMM